MKKLILLVLGLFIIGCDNSTEPSVECSNSNGVYLWGVCYDIATTTELNLDDNLLTGSIPDQIGDLVNLNQLFLRNNQLTGEIPTTIGNLSNLEYLWLSHNQLSGEIPSELYNLNLDEMGLNSNNLSGNIDSKICTMGNSGIAPIVINFQYNNFCPPYPSCLTSTNYDPLLGQDTSNCP